MARKPASSPRGEIVSRHPGRDPAGDPKETLNMLRTLIAVIAITFFAGSAWAVDDATSENDAIQLDQNNDPNPEGSWMKPTRNDLPDPGEAREMEASDIINN